MGLQQRMKEIMEFTSWINSVFKNAWKLQRVENIIDDLSSGVLLLHLAETLVHMNLPLINKNPRNVTQRLENIEMSLEAFREDRVEMPGILAQDIAEGDVEVILTLCCFLKHHYTAKVPSFSMITNPRSSVPDTPHATNTKFQKETKTMSLTPGDFDCASPYLRSLTQTENGAEKLLDHEYGFVPFEKEDIAVLDWVSNMTGRLVEDYNAFKDGLILCEVINSISLRRIPQKVIARSSSKERIKLALNTAAYELGIETELTAEDIASCRYQQSLRSYLGLLRQIHIKQIETLKYSVRNRDKDTVLDSSMSHGLILNWLSDWSMASQSVASNKSFGYQNRNGPNGRRIEQQGNKFEGESLKRENHLQIERKQYQNEIDDSVMSDIRASARVSVFEKSLSAQKNNLDAVVVLTVEEIADAERRKKREILRKQVNGMQKSIEELKQRMKKDKKLKSADPHLHLGKNTDKSVEVRSCDPMEYSSSERNDCESSDSKVFSEETGEEKQPRQQSKVVKTFNGEDTGTKADAISSNCIGDAKIQTDASKVEGSRLHEEHTIEHSRTGKERKDKEQSVDPSLRKYSDTSTRSTSSSLSQVAHDVTRLVRLSSRRPKGSVE